MMVAVRETSLELQIVILSRETKLTPDDRVAYMLCYGTVPQNLITYWEVGHYIKLA